MRREGRQRGWVRAYDRDLVDTEGVRRRAGAVRFHAVEGLPAVANGGYVRAPRKPTNHSKSGGAGGRAAAFGEMSGKAAASSASSASCSKGSRKFRHDEVKTYYLDWADAVDGWCDYLYDFDP